MGGYSALESKAKQANTVVLYGGTNISALTAKHVYMYEAVVSALLSYATETRTNAKPNGNAGVSCFVVKRNNGEI